jgi:hypothetical protein
LSKQIAVYWQQQQQQQQQQRSTMRRQATSVDARRSSSCQVAPVGHATVGAVIASLKQRQQQQARQYRVICTSLPSAV